MRILSAASAFPEYHYTQRQLIDAFLQHWGPLVSDVRKLELLHHNVGVDGRYLARPIEQYVNMTFGQANNVWIETAQRLGAEAVSKALALAGIPPDRPGAIIFVSVTGISSPSIDALLVNRLGLSPHIRRTPIFGLGCVAGAAGLARAADYVRAYPDQYVILLSVELCSLTLQRDDVSPANLISTGLFGDGAAAVIVAGRDCPQSGIEIVDTCPTFYPDTEDVMGWAISEKGFRIVLSPSVPEVIAANVGRFGFPSCPQPTHPRRYLKLDSAHRRPQNPPRHAAGPRNHGSGSGRLLGLPATHGEPFLHIRSHRPRRNHAEPPSAHRHLEHTGSHGPRLLLRTPAAEVVISVCLPMPR